MTNVSTYQYLKFVPLKDFYDWDYETYFRPAGINHHYPLIKLSNVLTHRNEYITIDEEREYKRCKVQLYGRGIVLRDIAKGKDIKVKRQQVCKADEILVAEIDAKVGGYGLLPKELEGAIVSSHYFLFQIDFHQIDKEYLDIYLKTDEFFKQVKSTGSTNYAAIRPYHFLDYKISLPPKDVQRKLVEAYQLAMSEAAEAAERADEIEQSIENYLLDELGIEIVKNEVKKGLQFVSFKELERWDSDFLLNPSQRLNTKYDLISYDEVFLSLQNGISARNYENENSGIRYLRVTDIKQNQIVNTDRKFVGGYKSSDVLNIGTLLITRKGTVGQSVIFNESFKCVASSEIFIIQIDEQKINKEYLSIINLSKFVKRQIREKNTGTIMASLSQEQLKSIKIPSPPLPIQERIVDEINTWREQIKILRDTAKAKREQAKTDFENALFEQ